MTELYCAGRRDGDGEPTHPERILGWVRGNPQHKGTFYFTPWSTTKGKVRYSQQAQDGVELPLCPTCGRRPEFGTERFRQLIAAGLERVNVADLPF